MCNLRMLRDEERGRNFYIIAACLFSIKGNESTEDLWTNDSDRTLMVVIFLMVVVASEIF